jgi:hypothetical protein
MKEYLSSMWWLLTRWYGFADEMRAMWNGIKIFPMFIMKVAVRVALILILPVSAAVMVYATRKVDEAEARQRERMRKDFFRNGRGEDE